jgi:hypothetical protein
VHVPNLNETAPSGVTAQLPLTSGTGTTGNRPNQPGAIPEDQREQMYLDMLNADHLRRGEPAQVALDASDRERMYDLWGQPGATTPGTPGSGGQPDANRAPTTMHWVAGRGFVAEGPDAEAASSHMRDAWGGLGRVGAVVAPTAFVDGQHQLQDAHRTGETSPVAGTAGAPTTPAALPAGAGGVPGAPPAAGGGAAAAAAQAAPADSGPHQMSMGDAVANLFGIHRTHPEEHAAHEPPIDLDRLDMEQLSVRIYDHLRRRLRQELLVDRERAGLLTDYR